MKLLLDECLPKQLKNHFKGHDAKTTPEMGWGGKTNGELLALAANRFDVFITADQNLSYQQNLETAKLGVIVFCAIDNKMESLIPLVPEALEVLKKVRPGSVQLIGKKR